MQEEVKKREATQQVMVKMPVAISTPDNINYVYDYENIFTPKEEKSLDSLMRTFEKSNLIAIKLVTLGSDKISADDFEQNNMQLLQEWNGVHGNSGKTIVISASKSVHKVSIDGGQFASKFFSPTDAASIIKNAGKEVSDTGQYYMAMLHGLQTLMNTIRRNINFNPQPATPAGK